MEEVRKESKELKVIRGINNWLGSALTWLSLVFFLSLILGTIFAIVKYGWVIGIVFFMVFSQLWFLLARRFNRKYKNLLNALGPDVFVGDRNE
ncbi:MAG: hypothetical protein PHH01_03095 [Patescibacteria group bacterium]|nr:hypothetical protein [Patescibacteria group bacterium]